MKEENQSKIMQLLDKKQWNDALAVAKELNISEKSLITLKRVFEIKGKDTDKVLKEIEKTVKNYEKAVSATENLKEILALVDEGGIKFDVTIEAGFARGLEYYTGMIYEVTAPELDVSLAGGGRYDRLIELFGGEPTPAVGVAHGIDRIMLAMEKQQVQPQVLAGKRVMIVCIGEELRGEGLRIASMLRSAGVSVELEVMGRTVTRALQDADRKGITHAIIIGPKEMKNKAITFRDMKKHEQHTIKKQELLQEIETTKNP
jgi:histidyl-tRNA synthetase